MCGLTGVLLYPTQRSPEEWAGIKEIAIANLTFNEVRGREASGMTVIQQDGTCHLFKQPVPATDLVTMDGFHEVMANVGPHTTCILGHTRAPTKGTRWNNANNHPLHAGHVVGIHNGTIDNDDALFEELQIPRIGEVDSEIIFQLQNQIDPRYTNGRYAAEMQHRSRILDGSFATLSVDLREPTSLLVLKHLRPLCVHYDETWRALFFSSRYVFLRKSFGRSVITEALDSGYGYIFDARHLPTSGNQPLLSFEIEDISERNSTPPTFTRVAYNR
ncbi:MAG: hypothetical protein JXD18_10885 [Anaerolineae bacterium]|nr:hypothetical protein [Anaerolineae bacterium]